MPTLRCFTAGALLLFAVTAAAQTEYTANRDPAMQRLGQQLQADQLADARHDLADYLTRLPGDASPTARAVLELDPLICTGSLRMAVGSRSCC